MEEKGEKKPSHDLIGKLTDRLKKKYILDQKDLMGWVCLSVCHTSTAALHSKTICPKANKGNQPESKFEALAKRLLTSVL
jgi:hypothetical protein